MHRVARRAWIMVLFLTVLLGGTGFFLVEYFTQAQNWVTSAGSAHIYHNGNLGCGTVYDRSGELLLTIGSERTYADNAATRTSTLHWLGDRKGYISAGAVSHYAAQMAGFNLIDGVYHAEGSGGTAQLTLSAKVQNAALNAMNGRRGTVAVYNYKTGEILCALTSPAYDPDNVPDIAGDTSGKYEGVYLNRFLQSAYVPGSIFKTVTTAIALETVPDIEERTFTCTGKYAYGDQAVTCERAHGTQDLKKALANSCNCGFAQIAEVIGRKNMTSYVEKLQVVKPISFDGVTTAAGNYSIKDTGAVSFAWSAIGQHTDQINPCRFMTYMGMVAGGGQAMEPYLVSKVTCGEETTYAVQPQKTDRVMSKSTAETLAAYMRNNVQTIYGAGNFPGLTVCGKSGTSQLGGGQTSNAMFAGFVTDEKYPLAFICVVENGGYGANTCVPILSKVLAACKTVLDQ